jgi:P-type Mg2+ transporter
MGTPSNLGNMFSAAGRVAVPEVPADAALPDPAEQPAGSSQMAIPTDAVDEEQLRRPSHWEIRFSASWSTSDRSGSVFDFATFAVMLWVFHSGPAQFRSGWFLESLATQTLVIFAIRIRRIPFFAAAAAF